MKMLFKKAIVCVAIVCMLTSLMMPAFAVQRTNKNDKLSQLISDRSVANFSKIGDVAKTKSVKAIRTYIRGDVTLDDTLNTGDATLILRYAVSLLSFDELQLKVADINADGHVNTGDAVIVLRTCVGLEAQTTIDIDDGEVPQPTEFTVSYFDGTDDVEITMPASATLSSGDTYTVDAGVPVREGYTFMGWLSNIVDRMSMDDDYIVYNPGNTFVMPAFDVTLTATWEVAAQGEAIVTIIINDVFNKQNNAATTEMHLSETTTLTASNVTLPEGYKLSRPQQQTVTVTGNTCTPSTVTFEAYPYYTDEANNEYKVIITADGLKNVRNDLTANYIMKNDIDGGALGNWEPMGWGEVEDVAFTGIFDGNGCVIEDFLCDWTLDDELISSNVGFFAINEGTIRNLIISTFNPETEEEAVNGYGVYGHYNVGAIAGRNGDDGMIENCYMVGVAGALDLEETTRGAGGGITGSNSGAVKSCAVIGGVEGYYYIGGITGKNFGSVDQCYFIGDINSVAADSVLSSWCVSFIGGIAGGMQDGSISNSYVYCDSYIKGYQAVGGIVGWVNRSSISCAYVAGSGTVYANNSYGEFYGYALTTPTMSYTYAEMGYTELPQGFDAAIWDLNGASYRTFPDLINNRRPELG